MWRWGGRHYRHHHYYHPNYYEPPSIPGGIVKVIMGLVILPIFALAMCLMMAPVAPEFILPVILFMGAMSILSIISGVSDIIQVRNQNTYVTTVTTTTYPPEHGQISETYQRRPPPVSPEYQAQYTQYDNIQPRRPY